MEDKLNELKLILEAGDNAKEAAFAYFAADLVGMTLWFVGSMIFITLGYKLLKRVLEECNNDQSLQGIAEILGTKLPGHFSTGEVKATMDKLYELARKESDRKARNNND